MYALKKWFLFHNLNLHCGSLQTLAGEHRKAGDNELLQRERERKRQRERKEGGRKEGGENGLMQQRQEQNSERTSGHSSDLGTAAPDERHLQARGDSMHVQNVQDARRKVTSSNP